jgi:DMATS type aromatic prenyltransferase
MVTTAEILKKAARPLEFPNKDQKFWWDATAHSLAELLARSGYTEEEQAAHLAWYRRFIPHTLGPRPVVGKPYTFVPGPVFDGSPVEHSINWKEKSKSKRLVRFTVGPASFEQADDQDPFSQDEVRRFLECQMDAVPGLSLERFNTVCENLFIKPENYASLIARIPDYTPRVQAWVAFDLVPTPMAKVYFVPMLKWLETGKTLNEIAFETTIACNTEKNGSFDAPVAFTKKYFDSFPVETRPRVEFMAIDCVDSPSSRIKHYVRTKANTFNKVVDLYTLGGSLKSEDIDAGISALRELWPLIFRLDVSPEELGDAEVWPTGGPGAGAAIEMRPGQEEPEVKIHWPVRLINGTDEQLADSLATYFRQRGHGEFADNYKSDLKAAL